jgi:hypothetical protein
MLPQQRLLLELLSMSGDIAAPTDNKETILWRTLDECKAKRRTELSEINPGMCRVSVTAVGRIDLEKVSS